MNSTPTLLDLLRREILLGQLAPGSFVRQNAVAKRFGVSRTPIREALKALESEGLLENLPARGYRTRDRTLRDLVEIIDVRSLLEGYAAKLAAETNGPDLPGLLRDFAEKIDTAKNRYLRTRENDDLIEWSQQEQGFHHAIIEACQNRFLARLVRNMDFRWIDLLSSGVPNPQEHLVPTHRQISDAIAHGDAEMAEKLANLHVSFYKNIGIESHLGPTTYWNIQHKLFSNKRKSTTHNSGYSPKHNNARKRKSRR